MKKKTTEIVPHPEWKNKINYEKPEPPPYTTSSALTGISNAYDAHAYLDPQGRLWVAAAVLHTILRTTISSARFITDSFDVADKIVINGEIFVRGHQINSQITKEIEKSGLQPKGNYLRFSEGCLNSIRDSDTAQTLRGTYEEYWKNEKRKLKTKRIKLLHITQDELTGKKLVQKTAEFSHIRSSDRFKELSLHVENGLIVNKQTHNAITLAGINNEEELLYFCGKKKWKTDWYEEYRKYLAQHNL